MFSNITAPKLLALTLLVILTTVFLAVIVILDEPPAFFAYAFGIINGSSWAFLIGLFIYYFEDDDHSTNRSNP